MAFKFLSIGCGTVDSESVKRLGAVRANWCQIQVWPLQAGRDKYPTLGEGRDTPLDFCTAVLEGVVDESRKKGRGRTVPQSRVM